MIDVQDLVFDYPGHRALRGVGLHITAGSVTALVGPNGAGKSTLLRCLAGLDTPLSGRIHVDGVDVLAEPRQAHRKLGYLSDFFGLYEELSVARCLQYAAAAQGVPAADVSTRAQITARQLGLQEKWQTPCAQLSRGQRQRVAIGQAIVHNPRVLLLDEPASGLDPEARSSLSALFRQLQAQGMTLVVSSHILSELDEYCTHILAIRDGRITQHESLTAAGQAPGQPPQVLMAIQLAAPTPQLGQWLQGHAVQHLDPSAQTPTTVLLPAHQPAARAALLAHLVQAGAPVTAYYEARVSLQDSYARSLDAVAAGFNPAQGR